MITHNAPVNTSRHGNAAHFFQRCSQQEHPFANIDNVFIFFTKLYIYFFSTQKFLIRVKEMRYRNNADIVLIVMYIGTAYVSNHPVRNRTTAVFQCRYTGHPSIINLLQYLKLPFFSPVNLNSI